MTFSAAAGGADSFTLAPYDACLGVSDEEARRLASNTQAILARESRLGAVDDPAAGSGYIEELTETLAREGWTRFQEIQRAGGLTAARESGWLDSAIAEAAEVEERGVRTRRRGLIGVSEFPLLDEELPQRAPKAAPIVGTRLAAPFEVLRDRSDAHLARTGSRPRAYLANLGAIPEHRARATFSANLLAAGGIEALSGDGFDDVEATVEAFASSKATLCVICSSDERYAQSVPTLATALTERGAVVVVAGRPGEHEDAWRAAGVAHFIHLGCDALAVLEQLQSAAGVEA